MSRTPSLGEAIQRGIQRQLDSVSFALPAQVETYDAVTQKISAKPLIKKYYEAEDGSRQLESLPIISNVPVLFPGGGGFMLTFPLQRGDPVMLVFSDLSLDKWLATGGEVDPVDPRAHDYNDAVAIPGLRPFSNPKSGVNGTVLTLGSENGVEDWAALASKVQSWLTTLATAINAIVPGSVNPLALPSIASATVKIKG